jgi:thiamine pyrophosphokinase
MRIAIVASLAQHHELIGYDRYIGCDYGAYVCAQANIMMQFAVGDFDSVTSEQFENIKEFSHEVMTLQQDKDVSDTEFALTLTSPADEVVIIGGLGGRIDHEWSNMLCLLRYPHAKLINDHNVIFVVDKKMNIKKEKQYMSLFPMSETIVTLQGVKYPLKSKTLKAFDTLCLSNEIIEDSAIIEVNQPCIMILSE